MANYDEIEDVFEQTGQYEPITTRIRNILNEYKDGVGILKELIQNADDAGATTVKFLIDQRHGPTTSLFSPGMAECQGPALWAYNDEVFSEKDFENITKLAGETKVENISKIGRFGLGFNAVYHLTDVPIFISQKRLVVFDPNTHHLQDRIKEKSVPGISINLHDKPKTLSHYRDQLQPFHGVFGCNTIQSNERFYYPGTLFRFPLRTAVQAKSSEISGVVYDETRIKAIISSICDSASTLLLFSQNVKQIEIYELDESCSPGKMRLVLSVLTSRLDHEQNPQSFLTRCSNWWKISRMSAYPNKGPSKCKKICIITTQNPSRFSSCKKTSKNNTTWLVVSASGKNASLTIASSTEGKARGLLPCAGVACPVDKLLDLGKSQIDGELFCFLPLSISTGLPVHVNGSFAIMPNRVEIWKRTNVRNQIEEVKWNEALMGDALVSAYILLLNEIKNYVHVGCKTYYNLWPNLNVVDIRSWEKLVQTIVDFLLNDQNLELFYSDGCWLTINEGIILSEEFDKIHENAANVLRSLGKHVLEIPSDVLITLKKFDTRSIVQSRTLSFLNFLKKEFFPNIQMFDSATRNVIICFGLDRINLGKTTSKEEKLFQEIACIPTTPTGTSLERPCNLVHPSSLAATLFSLDDHRFPMGDNLCAFSRLNVLERLGMVRQLGWKEICERALSLAKDDTGSKADRSRVFIQYLNKRIDYLPVLKQYKSYLQNLNFLPVLHNPPNNYLLPWRGSQLRLRTFVKPSEIFLKNDANLVGASCFILDESPKGCGRLNDKVKDLFELKCHLPTNKLVMKQLDEAIKFWKNKTEEERTERMSQEIRSVCEKVYEFFNLRIEKTGNNTFVSELKQRDWLFLEGKFVKSNNVAKFCNGNGAPLLYKLPVEYSLRFYHLLEEMGIKDKFSNKDYICALYNLEKEKNGTALLKNEIEIACHFINEIDVDHLEKEQEYIGNIPLPDDNGILHRSKNVVVNLSMWLEDFEGNVKVHEKIPPQTAQKLGAKPLKNVILKKHSHTISYGESFGQYEDLTDRLSGILDGYPKDEVLKELIQNADDAKATKMHIIYDTRLLNTERIAIESTTSKEIQGPALCVYNNKPFTDNDLEGIRKLGIGSKQEAMETTGRYGIGFNSVYHVTDCPSILSNNKTLVILDPCRRYVMDSDTGVRYNLDKNLREKLADTLQGYLGEYFPLKSSTIIRLPLRQKHNESPISSNCPNIEEMMKNFEAIARESLLFLNHLKEITLFKIKQDSTIEKLYKVEALIDEVDDEKRHKLREKIHQLSSTPSNKIPWEGISYRMKIKDEVEVEDWLIQKCIGSIETNIGNNTGQNNEVVDGREDYVFPQGGVAAKLSKSSGYHKKKKFCGIVFCTLPVPENYTELPVHVNGHFALDRNRRRLWTDTHGTDKKTRWNRFINSNVLPRAYAELLIEARKHLCKPYDNHFTQYYDLFPRTETGSTWNILTTELYRYLWKIDAEVFLLLIPTEFLETSSNEDNESSTDDSEEYYETSEFLEEEECIEDDSNKALGSSEVEVDVRDNRGMNHEKKKKFVDVTCTKWLPASRAYFQCGLDDQLLHLLLKIGLPLLLYAPFRIHRSFTSANTKSLVVTPKNVLNFLHSFKNYTSVCSIRNLPKPLDTTTLKNVENLKTLIEYCAKDEDFSRKLNGLPLLLTQDGMLRVFDSQKPVFLTEFGDLFPNEFHKFIHSEIVCCFLNIFLATKKNPLQRFTVENLEYFLRKIFPDYMQDEKKWITTSDWILSKKWLQKMWKFLENYTPRTVPLSCLSEFPLIPTTTGKLVPIKLGKTVLDLTETGNEVMEQKELIAFLTKLQCPILDKEITFETVESIESDKDLGVNEEHYKLARENAVTDAWVSHPHDAADVLTVLHHMNCEQEISLHNEYHDIKNLLRFLWKNYNGSMTSEHKVCIMSLPIHKTYNGKLVSLTGKYLTYAFVPVGMPTEQLEELQKEYNCLFLCSQNIINDPEVKNLYEHLGMNVDMKNLKTNFYVDYVLKQFGKIFTRKNQMKHLEYIRDDIFPSMPQGNSKEKNKFLGSMRALAYIPGDQGLQKASEFYDSDHNVFKVYFKNDRQKFLPSPFNDESWRDLLEATGLISHISSELFLKLCVDLQDDAKRQLQSHQNHEKSTVLLKHLFSSKFMRNFESYTKSDRFFSELSNIQFIVRARVEASYTMMHKQYEGSEDGRSPLIMFHGAVPWHYRRITWTTNFILPECAQPPKNGRFSKLGIAQPKQQDVVTHLENLANSFNDEKNGDDLNDVVKEIYRFLTKEANRSLKDDECKDIKNRLRCIPCVFLKDENIFVEAQKLVFKLPENCDFRPYLYEVPRDFGEFENFFKSLGAVEKPTPLQMANILNTIHEKIGDEKVASSDLPTVKLAIHMIFRLSRQNNNVDEIDELHLLTTDNRLENSIRMICDVSARHEDFIKNNNYPILVSLIECGLKEVADIDYIRMLPETLRPIMFHEKFLEVIAPECVTTMCPEARSISKCFFQQRMDKLLKSEEFKEGLERLLFHEGSNPAEFKQKIQDLQTNVRTKCVGYDNVQINIINRESGEIVGNNLEDCCFEVKEDTGWTLYFQHQLSSAGMVTLAHSINKILNKIIRRPDMIIVMLGSETHAISQELDKFCINRLTSSPNDGILFPEIVSDFLDENNAANTSGEYLLDDSDTNLVKTRPKYGGRGHTCVRYKDELEDDRFYERDTEEASRWLEQSKYDLEGARWLLQARHPFNALACYQSHQVVEKCLKSLLYHYCGITGTLLTSHKIEQLMSAFFKETGQRHEIIMANGMKVSRYYLATRYPNQQPHTTIPATAYANREAVDAVDSATEVFQYVQRLTED